MPRKLANMPRKTQPQGQTKRRTVKRTLVGVRIEPRLASVLRGLAELYDLPAGELLEQVFLAALEGDNFFAHPHRSIPTELRYKIEALRKVYGVTYRREDILRANRHPRL